MKELKRKSPKQTFAKARFGMEQKSKQKTFGCKRIAEKFVTGVLQCASAQRSRLVLFVETLGAQAITVVVQIVYGSLIGKIR